jgi:small subunit ribosomal protein S18
MANKGAPKFNISNIPARRPFGRRRKVCPFSGDNGPKIDYKDVKLLQRYISE